MLRRILLVVSFILCTSFATAQYTQEPRYLKLDDFEGVIFPASMKIGAGNGYTSYDLGEMEVAEAEHVARDYLQNYLNSTPDDANHQYYRFAVSVILGDLEHYRRQYVGLQDAKGQKIVYINYFFYREGTDAFSNWKESWVQVKDGGLAFFNLKVNLTAKEVIEFAVNGQA